MLKRIFIYGILGILLTACGSGSTNNTNSNNNLNNMAAGGNATNASNSANAANVNTTANSNANIKAAVNNSPKRISFGKGQNQGTSSVTLSPNATQLFVVSAKSGQTMDVEASSKDLAINLRKGKAQTTEDFGYLNAELQSNGDFVFEVKNTSKKEIKASIKVTIEGGEANAKKEEKKPNPNEDEMILEEDEEGSGEAEGEDKPQPTGTKKKGN